MDLGFLKRCVELKIVLDKFCESFSKDKTSRVCNISTKLKILMLLKQGKNTPKELIDSLAIAKSNITIICDSMMYEELITKEKGETNKKNIIYKITKKGEDQIDKFIAKLGGCYPDIDELPNIYDIEYKLTEVTEFLEKAMEVENAKNI